MEADKSKVIAEKSSDEKKAQLKESAPLSEYLKDYTATFSKDIDKLWDGIDTENHGYLDKLESGKFIDLIAGCIDDDRSYNYDKAKFEEMFA